MTGFIDKLGRNYIIATFIPSLGFVLLASYIFRPILPPTIKDELILSFDSPLVGGALLLFVQTLVLGYTLQGLNIFVMKLTEGYFILNRLDFMRRRQHRKALRRRIAIGQIRKLRDELEAEDRLLEERGEEKPELTDTINRLAILQRRLEARYRQDYPSPAGNILPTRFGNILRSAESYPNEQYKIDSVVMWPRLIHVMDPAYYAKMDESNNGLSFLVNSMLLSGALAILCILASAYQFSATGVVRNVTEERATKQATVADATGASREEPFELLYFVPLEVTERAQREYRERSWLYLIGSGLFMAAALFFYNASLPAARQYGNLIRSAYDLFRFDLMKALKLPRPKSPAVELNTWYQWTEVFTLGFSPELIEQLVYKYDWDETSADRSPKEPLVPSG
jgi:hypothetical protein